MPTEAERHMLYEKISVEWGEQHAEALMSHLPPVGWAGVATKQDLAALGTTIDARFDVIDAKFGSRIDGLRTELHKELASQLRWILGSTMTAMVVLTGLFAIIVGVLA